MTALQNYVTQYKQIPDSSIWKSAVTALDVIVTGINSSANIGLAVSTC